MRPLEIEALRERIAAARAEHGTEDNGPEPEPEDVDQINKRIFEGGDLSDLAARMFRY